LGPPGYRRLGRGRRRRADVGAGWILGHLRRLKRGPPWREVGDDVRLVLEPRLVMW